MSKVASDSIPINKVVILSPGNQYGDMELSIANALQSNNIKNVIVSNENKDLEYCDRVLIVGPMYPLGNLLKMVQDLPTRIWNTEQPPHYKLPPTLLKAAAQLRLATEGKLRLPGGRLRVLGEMLAVTSNPDARISTYSEMHQEFLAKLGIEAETVPPGYHPELGSDLGYPLTERLIDTVFLGSTIDPRRRKIIPWLQNELRKRSISFKVYDGNIHGEKTVYGDERTRILNGAKIMISVGRDALDDHIFRFCLGGANRIALVTETSSANATFPFQSNIHFVAESIEQLPTLIETLLNEPARVQMLADNLFNKVHEIPLHRQVMQVIR